MFKWRIKEFEISNGDGYNPFSDDQITDWLNEKGLLPGDFAMTWNGEILKIYYREWIINEDIEHVEVNWHQLHLPNLGRI